MRDFDKNDLRKLIFFLWKEGKSTSALHNKINNVLGSGTVSLSTCQRWVSNFNNGDFDVLDNTRSGRPSFGIDDQIKECLQVEKYATSISIASQLDNVSSETVRQHILNFHFFNLCGQNFPVYPIDNYKQKFFLVILHIFHYFDC